MRLLVGLVLMWASALSAQVTVQLRKASDAEAFYAWASDQQLEVEAICEEWGMYHVKNEVHQIEWPTCVALWQRERPIQRRYVPNDAELSLQKYLPLIQAPYLWDYQRTNLTRRGTQLVVALVDDGLDTSHPDLVDNIWVNTQEIPWNGIDDDGNGYVDDAFGWNSGDKSPQVFNSESVYYEHGTMVGGVLGARGNNGIGVSGVVPEAKLMPILCYPSNGVDTDLGVIRGMVYAYRQKQLWLQSQGSKGAPISVLNMSVGMDNAFPEDAPLWCAMFDSLGSVGIISVAATTNQNIDIGSSGDIPSLCSSKYLIVVSNSDVNDKPIGSGYSTEFVDLSAPGEGVHTTRVYSKNPSNPYKSGGGTSFAAPQVSGTLLLLHAESCFAYLDLREQDPDSALRLMTSWLMASVDTMTAFATRTKSSGRLQSYRAYQLMHDWCSLHDPLYQAQEIKASNLRVWPNPTNGVVHFDYGIPASRLKVYSSMGQKVYEGQAITQWSSENWPAGIYQVLVEWPDGRNSACSLVIQP
jgi:subtilisin family serine protease